MKDSQFIFPPGTKIRLSACDPGATGKLKDKEEAAGRLESGVRELAELQDVLYAQGTYALLIMFQAMDAAGKDGAIKHVMSGVNPQGCHVVSFKSPSTEELGHDYLWRCAKELPSRGGIGIFNRSYYEEVLVTRVHPELLHRQNIPKHLLDKDIWKRRYEQINNFEKYLTGNGFVILKFFLHLSRKEQKKRFLERIEKPEKNWKFSAADVQERAHWSEYMKAYEDAFDHTNTSWAPWHIIPADKKWFTRLAVADTIVSMLRSLHLQYPTVPADHKDLLLKARGLLEKET